MPAVNTQKLAQRVHTVVINCKLILLSFPGMIKSLPEAKYWLLYSGLIFGLAACSNANVSDLEQYVAEQKKVRKGRVPPLPVASEYKTYAYDSKTLRDPFARTRPRTQAKGKSSGIQPNHKRKHEVLEQFALDTLSMVGSLEQGGERWALIKSNDGTLYRLKRGNYLGHDNGRITKVRENKIDLLEIVADGLGGWVKRKSVLNVQGQSQ
jgi:type IV pilus assembly protein PilP